jgi:hypothetical protein
MAAIVSTTVWPCSRGGSKPNTSLDRVEQAADGFSVMPDRAVALDVGMAAQRADARPRPADIAAQQQQVDQLLHIGAQLRCWVRPMP